MKAKRQLPENGSGGEIRTAGEDQPEDRNPVTLQAQQIYLMPTRLTEQRDCHLSIRLYISITDWECVAPLLQSHPVFLHLVLAHSPVVVTAFKRFRNSFQ